MKKLIMTVGMLTILAGCSSPEKVKTVREMVDNPAQIDIDVKWCNNDPASRKETQLCKNATIASAR